MWTMMVLKKVKHVKITVYETADWCFSFSFLYQFFGEIVLNRKIGRICTRRTKISKIFSIS